MIPQIQAVSCKGSFTSAITSLNVTVAPLGVDVSMTLGGTLTSTAIFTSKVIQQQLVQSVADTLAIPSDRVQLVSHRDARRRLLALAVIFRVLASSDSEASSLSEKASSADFESVMRSKGLDTEVWNVIASVSTSPATGASPVPSPAKSCAARKSAAQHASILGWCLQVGSGLISVAFTALSLS
jgi:hypothetical protein